MVVMETVRAATLASSRRRRKKKSSAEKSPPFPVGSSSPQNLSLPAVTNGMQQLSVSDHGFSPSSGKGGDKVQEELVRYRQQSYVAPEKLQIVKPMEGSVTLLKWKLLASPQLGGATTYFSDASRPGVHLKKWKAGGIQDLDVLKEQDVPAPNSPGGLLSLEDSGEGHSREKEEQHEKYGERNVGQEGVIGPSERDLVQETGIQELLGEREELNKTPQTVGIDVASWLNTSTPLASRHRPHITPPPDVPRISRPTPLSPSVDPALPSAATPSPSSSLLGQVGSFLHSSWARIGKHTGDSPDSSSREDWRPPSSAESVSSSGISAMDPGNGTRTQ